MNRDRITPIILALLAVLALGASAATLDTARDEFGKGEGDGVGGDGPATNPGSPPIDSSVTDSSLLVDIFRVLFVAFVLIGCLALAITAYRNGWRSVLPVIAVGVFLLLLFYAIQNIDLSPSGANRSAMNQTTPPNGSGGGGDAASPVVNVVNEPATILFVLLAIVVVVAAILLARSTGNNPLSSQMLTETDETTDETGTAESTAVGKAAGRAADTIETDGSLSNAIYDAWQEMTTHLDIRHETSTPGEFATAAIEAGMVRDDVDELTELFEDTRYGSVDPSEEREQRAVAALRRIEREYTDE